MRALLGSGGVVALAASLSWMTIVLGGAAAPAEPHGPGDKPSPSIETHVVNGRIGCAAAGIIVAVSTADLCGTYGLTPGNGHRVDIPVGRSMTTITAAYARLSWTPSQPLLGGEVLFLRYPTPHTESFSVETSGTAFAGQLVKGPSPLSVRLELTDPSDIMYSVADGGHLHYEVRPAYLSTDGRNLTPGGWGGVLIDQPFQLCVVLAYEGAALPDDPCS
jgi:hypothetical protein